MFAAHPPQSRSPYPGFVCHSLDDCHHLHVGALPNEMLFSQPEFEELWNLHPTRFHKIMMFGRLVDTPRWQQAYGKDYHYTGTLNKARAIPPLLVPLLGWCQEVFDRRLNGILLNWYDGAEGHYIGPHRDSTDNMHVGAPIVTVSLGECRVFRLRPCKGKGMRDFDAADGTVFVMPYATNDAWKHEVPPLKRCKGHRISVTLRAFQ